MVKRVTKCLIIIVNNNNLGIQIDFTSTRVKNNIIIIISKFGNILIKVDSSSTRVQNNNYLLINSKKTPNKYEKIS